MDPAELDSAAKVVTDLNGELRPVSDRAVKDADEASSSTAGWSVSAQLGQVADSWRKALTDLHRSMDDNAEALRSTAGQHRGTDQLVAASMTRVG
ncbi:WXG100 family type VII secretion target [Kitasatospora gansuensis]